MGAGSIVLAAVLGCRYNTGLWIMQTPVGAALSARGSAGAAPTAKSFSSSPCYRYEPSATPALVLCQSQFCVTEVVSHRDCIEMGIGGKARETTDFALREMLMLS